MKKILSIFVLACIFLSPALTSSASAHDYDHVYTDVSIITPDSFEDIFSETEADRAAFTYEMVVLNSSSAVVAMEMEIKVGSDYYTSIVSGSISAYALPSGDTLYEGPISGTMTVGDDEYRVTVGFMKLESNGGVRTSVTMQGNSTMVAFAFGEELIQGEVLDFFMERANFAQSINDNNSDTSNLVDNLNADEFNNGNSVSPCIVGPGFAPITHPGDTSGYTPLGENGEYIFQDVKFANHGSSSYLALQSRVYWDDTRNLMMVVITPYSNKTQEYVSTLNYMSAVSVLDSFEVTLTLDADAEPSAFASIKETYIPSTGNINIFTDVFGVKHISNEYFNVVLEAFLDEAGVLAELINVAIEDITGSIEFEEISAYKHRVNIDVGANADLLDDLSPGFPIRFDLEISNETNYVGNTPYVVDASVKYFVIGETFTIGMDYPQTTYFYVESTLSHSGKYITLL